MQKQPYSLTLTRSVHALSLVNNALFDIHSLASMNVEKAFGSEPQKLWCETDF